MKQVKVFVVSVLLIGIAALQQVKPCVNVRALNPDGKIIVCEPIGKHLPDYPQLSVNYGADGGWTVIERDVTCATCTWEIADDYGNWHYVATTEAQTENGRTFARLVLGRDNAVTDGERYRVR